AGEVDSAQCAKEGKGFGGREAADLRRARSRREGRVEHVDVEGEEDGAATDAFPNEVGVGGRSERTQLVAGEDGEADRPRRVDVLGAVQRATQTGLHRRRRIDQLLLERPLERRPVEETLAEVLLPGVTVGVELDKGERPVLARKNAQLR